jgi:hypothetical protein
MSFPVRNCPNKRECSALDFALEFLIFSQEIRDVVNRPDSEEFGDSCLISPCVQLAWWLLLGYSPFSFVFMWIGVIFWSEPLLCITWGHSDRNGSSSLARPLRDAKYMQSATPRSQDQKEEDRRLVLRRAISSYVTIERGHKAWMNAASAKCLMSENVYHS